MESTFLGLLVYAGWACTFITPVLLLAGLVVSIVRFAKRDKDNNEECIKRQTLVIIMTVLFIINIIFAALSISFFSGMPDGIQ